MARRGRYAPSPTGRLHLGNARTALLSWLSIRAVGGHYVMRIEDLDRGRSRPEFETRVLEDLRWLGLDWDEGPDVGGPLGPYRQSECLERYAEAAARLDTYPCTCTRKEIQSAASAPHGATPVYAGTCARHPADPKRDHALRVRVTDRSYGHDDPVTGRFEQSLVRDVGDFVIRRRDGEWAYQLAVVVDDAYMQIDEVLRGADLLDSTPRQLFLQDALGYRHPSYIHVPLVLGSDGEKLSKRHGAPDLSALREGGADPERVLAALAASAGLIDPSTRRVRAADLVASFDLAKVTGARTTLPEDLDFSAAR